MAWQTEQGNLATNENLEIFRDCLRASMVAEIAALETRLLRWIVGSGVAITAAIIGGYFV